MVRKFIQHTLTIYKCIAQVYLFLLLHIPFIIHNEIWFAATKLPSMIWHTKFMAMQMHTNTFEKTACEKIYEYQVQICNAIACVFHLVIMCSHVLYYCLTWYFSLPTSFPPALSFSCWVFLYFLLIVTAIIVYFMCVCVWHGFK